MLTLLVVQAGFAQNRLDPGEAFQNRGSAPLERLRSRSAQERYQDLSEKWNRLDRARTRAAQIQQTANQVELKIPRLAMRQAETRYAEPVRSPSELKKISEIMPYFDYEPDPEVRKDDPCLYLCPRPDGMPCKVYPDGVIAPECPDEAKLTDLAYQERMFPDSVFNWEASNLYYNPLYFEDAPLERYGHTHWAPLQPFVSVGKFGGQFLGLPYQMSINPIRNKKYSLGWYRPGECAPKKTYQIPWNLKALAVTAAVYTGHFYAIP